PLYICLYLSCTHSLLFHSTLSIYINASSTTYIYTLSLHDALPIYELLQPVVAVDDPAIKIVQVGSREAAAVQRHERAQLRRKNRSEEHTSELQSPDHLVCRLLLEKKKRTIDLLKLQDKAVEPDRDV